MCQKIYLMKKCNKKQQQTNTTKETLDKVTNKMKNSLHVLVRLTIPACGDNEQRLELNFVLLKQS